MEQSSIINVLVLTELLPEGERLVTTLRKAGFRVHAEAVRDERWLRERLSTHAWELLFIGADNSRISAPRLGAILAEIKPDLLCLSLASAATSESLQTHIPPLLAVSGISDLDDPVQSARLLRCLVRELHSLHCRRQLHRNNSALKELQQRHQLLLDSTAEALTYLHDGMHVYVNAAYANLFDAHPAALLNTPFLDLVDESAVEGTRGFLRQQQHSPGRQSQEADNQDRRHRLRVVNTTGLPLELWLHCAPLVYGNEPALQIILRPLHGNHTARHHRSPLKQPSPNLQARDSEEAVADTPDSFLPQIEYAFADAELPRERLQLALSNDDFELLFQPIAGFMADGLERYSASLRLRDDTLAPARLLTAANRFGLGERLDRVLLSRCLPLLREGHGRGLRLLVNLTRNSMISTAFLPWLQQQLQQYQVESERLVLQLSELDIVDAPSEQVEAFCRQLRELRTALSVSHFGGSLDPFSYLPQHAAYVRLDQALVDGIDSDASKLARLQHTVSRLHASGLLTVSPLDRMELLPALWQARVNFVQGDCLQEAGTRMDFAFVGDEEVTLAAPHCAGRCTMHPESVPETRI